MLDMPFKALPAPLLVGLLIYAAICSLWLQPLVERRLAAKIYIPACEADAMQSHADEARNAGREIALQESLLQQLLQNPLAQFPGIREQIAEARRLVAEKRARLVRPPDHSSRCACAVGSAFGELGVPMLLHVMSARVFVPRELSTLQHSIRQQAGSAACRGLGK